MSLQAVPARPHDLKDALALLGRSQLPHHQVAENWGHYFVVREDDGRVVGVAGLEVHDSCGLLRSVAVDEDYRRQGLAASLVTAVVERARQLQLSGLYLLTTDAGGYFERHGFRQCPRQQAPQAIRASWEFRSGCPQTAILMNRPVG
ncbi:MAG TPA: arsenic resistance N-acetyltransferase ArsN2 [Vicinamibacteria bacterium]|nr:arsenic resistance N-acetyltransferase ArsN2 [Vicinamibacteria bacterium]